MSFVDIGSSVPVPDYHVYPAAMLLWIPTSLLVLIHTMSLLRLHDEPHSHL
jgi:hypothetical protein